MEADRNVVILIPFISYRVLFADSHDKLRANEVRTEERPKTSFFRSLETGNPAEPKTGSSDEAAGTRQERVASGIGIC